MITTTTQEITTMKIVTRIYLDDNGNCTCERHASAHLTASIIRNPFAHIHTTARGTWERMTTDDIRLDGADISCDRCESTTTKEITIMTELIDTPSVKIVTHPTQNLVSVILTVEQADILRDIMDFMRDDTIPENVEFADDLYIALNRSEEWTA